MARVNKDEKCFACPAPATAVQVVVRGAGKTQWVEKVCGAHKGPKTGGGGRVQKTHPFPFGGAA